MILMREPDGRIDRDASRDGLTMTDERTADALQIKSRIDTYLQESGLAARQPRVVPLTGDASDRRYFRILLDDGPSIVLALHAGPIEFGTLPFANVAELLQQMPLPVPAILGHSDADGIMALKDLGDVTLQAHLGAASAGEHAALYREGGRAHRNAAAARRRADLGPLPAVPHGVRRREADVGAEFLRPAFSRGVSRCASLGRTTARRSPKSGRPSPTSSRPSRGCCAIATITAAT